MATYEQYLIELNRKLSWIEKFNDNLTGNDERSNLTNKLLIELVSVNAQLVGLLVKISGNIEGLTTRIMRENPPQIAAQKLTVDTAGTAKPFPDVTVPYDMSATIRSPKANTGLVYIGNSKLEAEDHSKSFELSPGEAVQFKVKNLNQLYVDAVTSGESVVWAVEQEGLNG